MFSADDLGLERLVQFVRRKLPQPVTLGDRIRLSLHCRNPEKNEDKIYLITAHSPNGGGMNVTAHWGAREAKRLASQLKAMNLQTEPEVRSLVEKLKKEKVSAGYRTVPHAKLLTREARAFLEATLGLSAGPKVSAAPRGALLVESRPKPKSKPSSPKPPKKNSAKVGAKQLRQRMVKK